MARTLLKVIAALGALFLLALGVLAIALPRIVNDPDFQTTLHDTAASIVGSPVGWSRLEVGLLPPRLVVESPILVGADENSDEARLTAESIDLRLAWWRLPERRIEIDSLVLRGVELLVTRTPDEIILPIGGGEEAEGASDPDPVDPSNETLADGTDSDPNGAQDAEEEDAEEEDGIFELALRRLQITEARVIVRDQSLEDPIEWHLQDFELVARADSLDDPIALEVSTRILGNGAPVGGLQTAGTVTLGGLYDLDVDLAEIGLAALAPYLPEDLALGGTLSGRVSVDGATTQLAETELDLAIAALDFRGFGLALAGDLAVTGRQEREAPADFDIKLALAAGGAIAAKGKATIEGGVDAAVDLDRVDLAPFASLAGEGLTLEGIATGQVQIVSTAEAGVKRLATNLRVASARYSDATLDLAGGIDLVATMNDGGPVGFDIGLDLKSGGAISAKGKGTLEGAVDVDAQFDAVDLAPFAPLIPDGTSVGGQLSGRLALKAAADGALERVATDLKIPSMRVVSDPLDVTAGLSVVAKMTGKGPVDIDAGLKLSDGGTLDVEGTATLEGALDLEAKVERLDLALAGAFLPDPEMKLAGLATGDLRIVGTAASPEFVKADLGIESGRLSTADYSLEGPLMIDLRIKEPLSGRPRGRATIDLTAAKLGYGEQFKKAEGVPAEMVAKFVPDKSGDVVFEARIRFRDVKDILLQGFVGDSTSVAVTTPIFNLKGWDENLPVLEPYELDGPVAFEGLGVEIKDGSPSQFGGRLQFRGIGFTVPDAGRARLRGQILGEGTTIRTKGLKMLVGGLTLGFKGVVEEPLKEARYDVEVKSIGEAEVNDLFSTFTSVRDTVYGPLVLDGKVAGLAGEGHDPYETLEGHFRFTIGEGKGGRLRGVSILRAVLDQVPLLGGAAKLSQPFRGGQSVDDYFTERFEIIEGDFEMGGGKVNAKELRLAYEGYEARLTGPLKLKDMTIDMTGELLLKDDLVGAIGGLVGDGGQQREPIRIPLARVTNRLSDPQIEMSSETLSSIPKLIYQATGLDSIAKGAGKAIGRAIEGSSEKAGDALRGLLGGGKR